jgi:NTP pyrophosphatase (non-canonical NTP hydrolase)
MTLTFLEFSQANKKRCEHPEGFNHKLSSWSVSEWMTAVLGELGEAANIAKKLNRVRDGVPGNKETPEELREKFKKEIGDTYVYLDLLAQREGFMMEDVIRDVFNQKSKDIRYKEMV